MQSDILLVRASCPPCPCICVYIFSLSLSLSSTSASVVIGSRECAFVEAPLYCYFQFCYHSRVSIVVTLPSSFIVCVLEKQYDLARSEIARKTNGRIGRFRSNHFYYYMLYFCDVGVNICVLSLFCFCCSICFSRVLSSSTPNQTKMYLFNISFVNNTIQCLNINK